MFLELFCQYTNISLVALNSSDFFFLSFLVVFHTDAAHVGYLFYSRMAAVSRRRSRTISVVSGELAGSSRRFCIREHREQKLNMFNFFSWQGQTATDTAGRQAGFYTALTE